MCLCVLVCVNFEDEILLKGEECKTRENYKFSKCKNDNNNNKKLS